MPKPEPGNAMAFGPVISAYTRTQAIEDGILVDVSDIAREAGSRFQSRSRAPSGTASSPFPRATKGSRTSAGAFGTCFGWRATTRSAHPTATA